MENRQCSPAASLAHLDHPPFQLIVWYLFGSLVFVMSYLLEMFTCVCSIHFLGGWEERGDHLFELISIIESIFLLILEASVVLDVSALITCFR